MARILTQEEHAKIKAEQAMKGVVDIRRNLKSQLETSNSANKVSLSKIETVTSRRVSKEIVNLRGLIFIFRNTIKKADWLRYWQVVRTGQLMVKPSVKSIIQMHQRQIKTRKRINHSLWSNTKCLKSSLVEVMHRKRKHCPRVWKNKSKDTFISDLFYPILPLTRTIKQI